MLYCCIDGLITAIYYSPAPVSSSTLLIVMSSWIYGESLFVLPVILDSNLTDLLMLEAESEFDLMASGALQQPGIKSK